jgi:hypothetical protein
VSETELDPEGDCPQLFNLARVISYNSQCPYSRPGNAGSLNAMPIFSAAFRSLCNREIHKHTDLHWEPGTGEGLHSPCQLQTHHEN